MVFIMKKVYLVALISVFFMASVPNMAFSAEQSEITGSEFSTPKEKLIALEAVNFISTGNFEQAEAILKPYKDAQSPEINKINAILDQYKKIQDKRQTKKQELYQEQIDELKKLQTFADANGLEDTNDIAAIFSAAIKAADYADPNKKEQVIQKPLVQKAIEKALTKAGEHEQKGEWLESLLVAYSYLSALDEDNKQWQEHRDELTNKAIIKASLIDNPCETSEERHEGIKPEMFVRAIMALDYRYVTVINYTDVALKSLKRSKDLAQVLSKLEPNNSVSYAQGPNAIEAWDKGLNKLIEEVEKPITGISRDKFLEIFQKVLDLNKKTLKVSEEVLIDQYASASLAELDPHTNLIWPWYVNDFMKSMSSEFSGVGIEISKSEGLLKVNSLLPDTPAYNSGIDAGDIIEAVNGEPTKEMTIECAVRKITGPEGTDVVLTVRNPKDDKSRDINITRAKIKVATVRSWQRNEKGEWLNMIDPNDKIGYVKITSFTSEQTADELEKQLQQLEKQDMQALIIDLRFNSGGYLTQAVEIVDKFVKEGLIVSTRPRLGSFPQWEVATEKVHPDYPVILLINEQSASASEIVAGALQDKAYKRAILVGTRTYGKGSVQTIIPYPGDGAQLKYTMAYYHLPSGQRVKNRYEREKLDKEDWGIAPDVEVDLRSDEIRTLYDIQRDNAVLTQEEHVNGEPIKRYSVKETIESDPQLAIAILVAKAQLVKDQLVQDTKIANITPEIKTKR